MQNEKTSIYSLNTEDDTLTSARPDENLYQQPIYEKVEVDEGSPVWHLIHFIFGSVKASLGIGIVFMPFVIQSCGLLLGPVLLLLISILNGFTSYVMMKIVERADSDSFREITQHYYGKKVGFFFEFCVVVVCIGILSLYLSMIGKELLSFTNIPKSNIDI